MSEIIDERESSMLEPDLLSMIKEFNEGKPIGESANIEGLQDDFSWKRSFVNCWTGRPNFGKTTMLQFLATTKSKHDNWKWCIWSPEMVSSHKVNNNIVISAGDIYDELIHMFTGKSPYKHFVERYGIPQMSMDEYMAAMEWVQDRFFVIHPKDKQYKNVIDNFNYWYDRHGFDGWIIDPFKNLQFEVNGTMDMVLHKIFDDFKDVAVRTNSSVNIVAHPKSDNEPKKKDGSYKVVTQFNLLGGSAWDNSMDGIFSIHRPYAHLDPNDPTTWLYHLKQRKKHLVGNTGVYKHIEYNERKNRYYFEAHCPIDGSFMPVIVRDEDGYPLQDQPIAPPLAGAVETMINFEVDGKEKDDVEYDTEGHDTTVF